MKKISEKKEPSNQRHLRLPKRLDDFFVEYADKKGLNVNAMITFALTEWAEMVQKRERDKQ